MKQILFYAPLGINTPPERIGGAEAGCLRTLKIYEKAGYEVNIIQKPALSQGKIHYLTNTAIVPLKVLFNLLKNRTTVFHLVGFYMKIAWFEWLLMKIAKGLGHKVIYELRNGSMVWGYEQGTSRYKRIMKSLLIEPDVVLCQGESYVNFIKKKWGIERSFYPNYIMDEFIMPNNLNRGNEIKLIFFGRLIENKSIDTIIETLYYVRQRGMNARLDLIGGCNEKYKAYLDSVVKELNIGDFVTFHGRKPFGFIADKLRESNYFIFPSIEPHEGHSNSLTEAMGCGVVPIVSPAGFNETICGVADLVIPQINAKLYANKIIEIEQQNRWTELSNYVYDRVLKQFTQSIVSEKLISYLEPLFETEHKS